MLQIVTAVRVGILSILIARNTIFCNIVQLLNYSDYVNLRNNWIILHLDFPQFPDWNELHFLLHQFQEDEPILLAVNWLENILYSFDEQVKYSNMNNIGNNNNVIFSANHPIVLWLETFHLFLVVMVVIIQILEHYLKVIFHFRFR